MRKRIVIMLLIVVSFIGVNVYFVTSGKSEVPKVALFKNYKILKEKDYEEHLEKEALIVPQEAVTVHLSSEDVIEEWVIREGDRVKAGDELVLLQNERLDGQVDIWSKEREALEKEQKTILNTIDKLIEERDKLEESKEQTTNRDSHSVPVGEDGNVELNVNMAVGVDQSGSFAQAIAEAERDLAAIERQMTILNFQIEQNYIRPAIISPINGVIASIDKTSSNPTIEIYSNDVQVATFVSEEEWEKLKTGDAVTVLKHPLEDELEGTVDQISKVPATVAGKENWIQTYQSILDEEIDLFDLYEVRVEVVDKLKKVPFGKKVEVDILTNEETKAVAVPKKWAKMSSKDTAKVYLLNSEGQVETFEVETPFSVNESLVVTDGVYLNDVIVYHDNAKVLKDSEEASLFYPKHWPKWETWLSFSWKDYLRYLFLP